MKPYFVNSPVKHEGVIRAIGEPIKLADEFAVALLAAGAIVTTDREGYEAASAATRQAVEKLHGPGWSTSDYSDKARQAELDKERDAARRAFEKEQQDREDRAREAAEAKAKAEAEAKAKAEAAAKADKKK